LRLRAAQRTRAAEKEWSAARDPSSAPAFRGHSRGDPAAHPSVSLDSVSSTQTTYVGEHRAPTNPSAPRRRVPNPLFLSAVARLVQIAMRVKMARKR
jgi:hypothetical protein